MMRESQVSVILGTVAILGVNASGKLEMGGESVTDSTSVAGASRSSTKLTCIRKHFANRGWKRKTNEGVAQGLKFKLSLTGLSRQVVLGQPCICLGRLTLIHKQLMLMLARLADSFNARAV